MADHTILLVEDELRLAALYSTALQRVGFRVLEVETGAEALSLLRDAAATEHAPSLVVLDLILPEVDGLAVLRELAQQGYSYPVVAMSIDRERLAAARDLGANATLAMPFELAELVDAVAKHVG
jgi:DNA-binding response OmpR family regulator